MSFSNEGVELRVDHVDPHCWDQIVYNDDRVNQNFDMKAWVYVSNELDISIVTEKFFEALSTSHASVNGDYADLEMIGKEIVEKSTNWTKTTPMIIMRAWHADHFRPTRNLSKHIIHSSMDPSSTITFCSMDDSLAGAVFDTSSSMESVTVLLNAQVSGLL
ncbi:uncharacterized protein LOC132301084 [Cornus florida]|uniref:uncharacterized protein LOC132301084 n=1 Tax=Cornus florida TaxID=4283 RepID=UPI00289D30F1|nr:uncharacterized protein LOC132301084 [Cornus florida]